MTIIYSVQVGAHASLYCTILTNLYNSNIYSCGNIDKGFKLKRFFFSNDKILVEKNERIANWKIMEN